MPITERAKQYHEKMFPGYVSKFPETDPEFIECFDNFAFDEVVNSDNLDGCTRFMAILATLLGCQGIDEFKSDAFRRTELWSYSHGGERNCLSGSGLSRHRTGISVLESNE